MEIELATLPSVLIRAPEGEPVRLFPGALIGRSSRADLRISHPGVSEAHGMISQRGRALFLLGLRGAFHLVGRRAPQRDLALEPGQEIRLANDVTLTVLEVDVPPATLYVRVGELVHELLANENSLLKEPTLRWEEGASEAALVCIFTDGETWWARIGRESRPVFPGEEIQVCALVLTLFEGQPVGTEPTRAPGRLLGAISITATSWKEGKKPRQASVEVEHGGITRPLKPAQALIFWALAFVDQQSQAPFHWKKAAELAIPECDAKTWSIYIARLKAELDEMGLPSEALIAHSNGYYRLRLRPGVDRVDMRSLA
jgi:hypothetical protein